MEQYFSTYKKAVTQERSSKRHNKQQGQIDVKRMFKFSPDIQLLKQITSFNALLKNKLWNGNIQFCNFLGSFKIEYWIYIEKSLRDCDQIRRFKFTKSKLSSEHLTLLMKLLVWLQPSSIELEFNHNELDGATLDQFINDMIKSQINLKYLLVSNNPGIFRGQFLNKLSANLEKQLVINLRINDQFKSIILYNRRLMDEKCFSYIQKKLKAMIYHSFNLSNCFTEQNYQGFESLIQQCYSDSTLETIYELNISKNYLGPSALIESQFFNLSKAKGLLRLGLSNLSCLNQQICQALIGNRYSYLRLLELDLSNNSSLDESAISILLDEIVSKSCKKFNFKNTFKQEPALLAKLYHFGQAFRNRIKQNQTLNLEYIDFSSLADFQQYDLLEDLLKFIVFNTFSSVEQLVLSKLNEKVCQSYVRAIESFLNSKQNNKTLRLKTIIVKQQSTILNYDSISQLLNLIFFTSEQRTIQIEIIKFRKKCFEQDQNCFYFQQCFGSIDSYKQYTLKHVYFKNTFATDKLIEKIIEVFLLGNYFPLETFSLKEQDFNDTISLNKFLLQSQFMEQQIDIKFYSLTKLTLSVVGLQLNISLFLRCFILNRQVKLKYLNLSNSVLQFDQLQHQKYIDADDNSNLFLEVIKFINNSDPTTKAFNIFSNYCLFSQDTDLEIMHISEINCQIPDNMNFPKLKKICFYDKFKNFDTMLKIILNSNKLEEIVFKRVEINDEFVESYSQAFLKRRQAEGSSPKIFFFIKSVSFIDCIFLNEPIHLFFIDYHFELENLKIIQCKGIENQFEKLNEKLEKYSQFINTQLKRLQIQNCKLSKYFQSFLRFLELTCFNAELIEEKDLLCQIEEFTLQHCQLNDQFMSGLNDLIQIVVEQDLVSKRFMKLVNFSDNNQIKAPLWKKFYSLVLNQRQQTQLRKNTILNQDFSSQELAIQELVQQNHLNLNNKLLKDPQKFVQKPPQKLQGLQLKFLTNFQSANEQSQYYFSMVYGLIFYKENKLTNLKLSEIDLEQFVNTTQQVLERQQKEQSKKLNNIKKLSISSIQSIDITISLTFYQIFIQNLTTLKLSDAQSGIIEGLLIFLQNYKGKLLITTFCLTRINEYLNVSLSNQFLQDIIFGGKMLLKKLCLDNALSFKSDPDFVKSNFSSAIPKIQKITFKIQNQDSFQFLQSFSRYFLESQNLQEFVVESQQYGSLLFEDVDLNNSIPKLNILKLKSKVDLSPKLLEYIQQNQSSLQKLSLQQVFVSNKESTERWFQQSDQVIMNCCLSTKIEKMNEQDQNYIVNNLLLGRTFQWSNIKYKSSEALQYLQIEQNFRNLKKLEINAQFESTTNKKISTDFLQQISEHLIYNQNSQLKELKLIKCNITVTQIFKLISKAENYLQTNQSELSLKRFCLCNSQNIDDEAFKELCENLIFCKNIRLEVLELVQLNLTNQMINYLVESGKNWIKQQIQQPFFSFVCLNFAFNDTIGAAETWDDLCKTFLFSDLTPNLAHLFLNGMDIKNHIAKLIANNAFQYFRSKPLTFKHSLKEIDFSQNKSLNELGWYFLSKYFFFIKNVDLLDIDVTECELNEEKKINQFMLPIYDRVQQSNSLGIYKFRSDNIQLKNLLYAINKIPRKLQFKFFSDIPFQRIKYPGWGSIEGKILQFGILQKNIIVALNQQRRVNFNECWKSVFETKFGIYHLRFIENFLHLLPIIIKENSYSFSYFGLDQLFNFFTYPQSGSGSPYPLSALFNPKCQDFFSESNVNKITLVETFFPNLEKPKQTDIWRIYHNIIQKKNNLDLIELEYTLDDDLLEYLLENGYTEKDIIKFIRLIPPSHVIIQNSLSLQAIKGIYSIMFENNYFQYSHISYDHKRFYNNGIGYSLRAIIYGINVQNKILIVFKKIIYYFLSIFVSDAQKYTYSNDIKKLNLKLQNSLLYFDLLIFLTLSYLFMCIGIPIILTMKDIDSQEDLCKKGVNQIATYSYYGFAFISLIFETYMYQQIVKIIPSHVAKLIDEESLQQNQIEKEVQKQSIFGFLQPNKITPLEEQANLKDGDNEGGQGLLQRFNTNIREFAHSEYAQIIQFFISIIFSQLSKYDLYNDVVFIINCYNCKQSDLFNTALVITAINLSIYMIYFIEIFIRRIQRIRVKIKYLSTQTINDYFDLCSVGRNDALSQLLDNAAPYNVSVFPNNRMIRKLIPNIAGKSMNKSIKNYLIKFILEDVPQLTIQLIFIYRLTISSQITLGWSIYITLSISIVAIILSFFKFMKLRPSTISQTDFDKLERNSTLIHDYKELHFQKEKFILKKYEQYLQNQEINEGQADGDSQIII